MIPANAMQLVKELHNCYTARTGFDIAYNMARENTWRDWCQFGDWKWTTDDLARVIFYLRSKINKGDRNEGALKFTNLIGRPENFEEDLQLARKERQQALTPRRPRPVTHSTPASEDKPMDSAEAVNLWKQQFGR